MARAFDVSDRFWLNLQNRYDLEIERMRLAEPLAAIRKLSVAV
jgi:plasmid maintenance system antidote protein VapI